ncbi:MAG: LacI family DNA-binding transcriptional regulator [Rhizobiales bacterium]|nr:LacI family DNA-binding transcriptional regulator [Hyphomicrobiales bacterium]
MATIYDVARAANVSPKTVSRVLNGDAPVKHETRDAVESAIRRLGYVPSSAARTMRSNRSGLVGVVAGAISLAPQKIADAGMPEIFIVQGIQRRMEAAGRTLLISDTGGHSERVPHLMRTFAEHRVEGMVYVAAHHQKVFLPEPPRDSHLVLANCFDDRGTPAIVPDDRDGQRRLVAEVVGRGHRRVAYLTLGPSLIATTLRTEGYRLALAEAGIPFDPALVAVGEESEAEDSADVMRREVRRMLALRAPPTVFCCGNDRMAIRLYGVLRSEGHRIPDEVSVAGYDNYRLIAETLFPTLTTFELPYAAMGVRAAERLLSLIDGGAGEGEGLEEVGGEIAWRDSVATKGASRKAVTSKGGKHG